MKKEDIEANVIYYTTNVEVLAEVVKKTDEVKDSDLLKSEFVLSLGKYIMSRTGIVLVSFDETKKLNGCVVLSRHIDKQGEFIWIDFRWADPHCRGLMSRFYNEVIEICKARGIKRIQGRTRRGFKAIQKLYGAYEIGRIFEIGTGGRDKDDNGS